MTIESYRQGDLLFIKIDNIPDNYLNHKEDNIILQSSSIANPHIVKNGYFYPYQREDSYDRKNIHGYLDALGETNILHKEHPSLPIPKGYYKIIRQKEANGYVID